MAQSGNTWRICDDCFDPLAVEFFSLARRCRLFFDVTRRDALDNEARQIIENANYDAKRLTEDQRKQFDHVSQQMETQTEPPTAGDVDMLYRRYRIDMAIDWLKFNVSVEYADDFKRTLVDAKKRFSDLEFKACKIINGDEGKESTIVVRYAIQRLMDRHYELLRKLFTDHEHYPTREELPDDLHAFEVEILDEYTEIEHQFRDLGNYLRRASALVRAKMKKVQAAPLPESDDDCWSIVASPSDWAKRIFHCDSQTLTRKIKAGEIRAINVSTRKIRIHLDELPADYKEKLRS